MQLQKKSYVRAKRVIEGLHKSLKPAMISQRKVVFLYYRADYAITIMKILISFGAVDFVKL